MKEEAPHDARKDKPILSDEILIVPLREISYEDAKKEIANCIQHAGVRKVYISELAEELRLDFELIMKIIRNLRLKDVSQKFRRSQKTINELGKDYGRKDSNGS